MALDVETKDPNLNDLGPGTVRGDGYVVGVGISTRVGDGAYVPLRHPDSENFDERTFYQWLAKVLQDPAATVVGTSVIYDLEWCLEMCKRLGIATKLRARVKDVQVAEALIDEEQQGYSLEAIGQRRLRRGKNEGLLTQAAVAYGFGKKVKDNLWQLPARFVGAYGEQDADLPLELIALQEAELARQDLNDIWDLECRVTPVLLAMKQRGVPVDLEKADELSRTWGRECEELWLQLKREGIDPESGKSLQIYCQRRNIQYWLTDKGNASFTGGWLEQAEDPTLRLVARYRHVNKLRRDFVDGFIFAHHVDGRLYSTFNQLKRDDAGTRSGRLSSQNPNLQQVPARDEELAPLIRQMFIPDEGLLWGKLDYSQQEPRVLVHLAYLMKMRGADKMHALYVDNPKADFHQLVADMASIQRKAAKGINLGMFYGMGIEKLARQLGLSVEEAEPLFAQYHEGVPFVRDMQELTERLAGQRGWVKTIGGRKRHFNFWEPVDRRKRDGKHRSFEEARAKWEHEPLCRMYTRKALNGVIQGSGADMTKKAMVDRYEQFDEVPYMQVHDELDFPAHDEEHARSWQHTMEHAYELSIPMRADLGLGPNWGAAK